MPPQGRLGDKAFAPADAHGCPACPHPVTGPAIGGSPDVNVNARPAIRVADPGLHAACCGPNLWTAAKGSATVFINQRAAHRLGDKTQHCGGVGKLVEGSPDVFVGDGTASGGGKGGGGGTALGDGGGGGAPRHTPAEPAFPPAPSPPPPPEKKVHRARGSQEQAGPDETVQMGVSTEGYPPGTAISLEVRRRDDGGVVERLSAQVTGDETAVPWRYRQASHGGADGRDRPTDDLTDYYFEATVAGETRKSGLLAIRSRLRIVVKDKAGRPLAGARFIAKIVGGRTIEGRLNERGECELDDVPPGSCHIRMIDHQGIEFEA